MSVTTETARILIVDDDRAFRVSTAALLTDEGYEVDAAPGGDDGLAKLREDASLIPQAVEEMLRYASPVMYMRYAADSSAQPNWTLLVITRNSGPVGAGDGPSAATNSGVKVARPFTCVTSFPSWNFVVMGSLFCMNRTSALSSKTLSVAMGPQKVTSPPKSRKRGSATWRSAPWRSSSRRTRSSPPSASTCA